MGALLNTLFVAFGIFLIGFVPGFLVLSRITSLNRREVVSCSFAVSLAFYGLLSFLLYLLNVPPRFVGIIIVCFLVLLFVAFTIYQKKTATKIFLFDVVHELRTSYLLKFYLLFCVLMLSYQSLLPVYTFAGWYGDWWEHFARAQFFLNHWNYYLEFFPKNILPSRTPFFNLIGTFFLSLFGERYWVFQVTSVLLNSLVIIGIYLLAEMLFDERAAKLSLLLVIFTPFMIRNSTYTWPKLFSAYYLLLSVYFYLKARKSPSNPRLVSFFAGLFGGLSYLAHQSAIFYLAGMATDWLVSSRRRLCKKSSFKVFYSLSALLLVILPWYGWMFTVYGAAKSILSTPTVTHSTSGLIAQWFYIRGFNLISTLFPLMFLLRARQLLISLSRGLCLFEGFQGYYVFSGFQAFYFGTLPGALTMTFVVLILHRFFDGLRKARFSLVTWCKRFIASKNLFGGAPLLVIFLFLFGVICSIVAQPFRLENGIFQVTMIPVALIALPFLAKLFDSCALRLKRKLIPIVVLEFTLVVWSQILVLHRISNFLVQDGNYQLKMEKGLIFLFDYLGECAFLTIPIIIAIQFYFGWLLFSYGLIPGKRSNYKV